MTTKHKASWETQNPITLEPMTASEMGKLGAQARIAKTTSEERRAWARKAGKASGKARRKKIKPYIEQRSDKLVQPTAQL